MLGNGTAETHFEIHTFSVLLLLTHIVSVQVIYWLALQLVRRSLVFTKIFHFSQAEEHGMKCLVLIWLHRTRKMEAEISEFESR